MVELADEPYQAKQKGDDGAPRKVWVFPLRKIGAAPSTQPKSSSNATLVESTLTVGQTVFHSGCSQCRQAVLHRIHTRPQGLTH